MMSTKFDSQLAEELYGETPDEELGYSHDGMSWYGLYRSEKAILVESTYGFVSTWEFDTDEKLMRQWEMIQFDFDREESE